VSSDRSPNLNSLTRSHALRGNVVFEALPLVSCLEAEPPKQRSKARALEREALEREISFLATPARSHALRGNAVFEALPHPAAG
jgi:hypothetical protein